MTELQRDRIFEPSGVENHADMMESWVTDKKAMHIAILIFSGLFFIVSLGILYLAFGLGVATRGQGGSLLSTLLYCGSGIFVVSIIIMINSIFRIFTHKPSS